MSVNSTMNATASSFKTYSDSIHSEGKNIFDKISGAFTDLSNLNTNSGWKGTRYDDVVDAFNKMVADFNSMIKDVEETIPNSLQNAAKIIDSYSPDPAGFTATTYASSSISEISFGNESVLSNCSSLSLQISLNLLLQIMFLRLRFCIDSERLSSLGYAIRYASTSW